MLETKDTKGALQSTKCEGGLIVDRLVRKQLGTVAFNGKGHVIKDHA